MVGRPEGAQNLCLDKGYDNPTGHGAVAEAGYQPHIRRIGEEKLDQTGEKIHPARRWVVERTFGQPLARHIPPWLWFRSKKAASTAFSIPEFSSSVSEKQG